MSFEFVNEDIYEAENYVFGTPIFRQYCLTFEMSQNQLITYEHL